MRKKKPVEPLRHKAPKRTTLSSGQTGAHSLLGCYALAIILSLGGMAKGIALMGDPDAGIAAGLLMMVFTGAFMAFLIIFTRSFQKAIEARRLAFIRNFSLFSCSIAFCALGVLYARYHDFVLDNAVAGGLAIYFLLLAFTALVAFAANRSKKDKW